MVTAPSSLSSTSQIFLLPNTFSLLCLPLVLLPFQALSRVPSEVSHFSASCGKLIRKTSDVIFLLLSPPSAKCYAQARSTSHLNERDAQQGHAICSPLTPYKNTNAIPKKHTTEMYQSHHAGNLCRPAARSICTQKPLNSVCEPTQAGRRSNQTPRMQRKEHIYFCYLATGGSPKQHLKLQGRGHKSGDTGAAEFSPW